MMMFSENSCFGPLIYKKRPIKKYYLTHVWKVLQTKLLTWAAPLTPVLSWLWLSAPALGSAVGQEWTVQGERAMGNWGTFLVPESEEKKNTHTGEKVNKSKGVRGRFNMNDTDDNVFKLYGNKYNVHRIDGISFGQQGAVKDNSK